MVVLQIHRIITGSGNLFRMIEPGTVTASGRIIHGTGDSLQLTHRRHQDDTTHLKLVETGKTFNGSIAIIIAGCFPAGVIPQMGVCRRSRFRHTERHRTGGEMEPAAMCRPDTRFHILGQVLRNRLLFFHRRAGNNQQACQKGENRSY